MVITQKYSREKWPHSKGLRQLARMACILLGKNNHKSFKMWMIDKLYNLIVNKNRSLEFNSQPKRGGGGWGGGKLWEHKEGTAMHKRKSVTIKA